MFYVLCFTLLSQLTYSILHDDAIVFHQIILIDGLSFVTHDCESHNV